MFNSGLAFKHYTRLHEISRDTKTVAYFPGVSNNGGKAFKLSPPPGSVHSAEDQGGDDAGGGGGPAAADRDLSARNSKKNLRTRRTN
jgi:hypothetical protein